MTEERKGPGFSIPCCGWVPEEDLLDHIPEIKIDPELKERLDASLAHVRSAAGNPYGTALLDTSGAETGRTSAATPRSGAIPKTGRGLTKHIITADDAGFCADVDDHGYPIGDSREDHAERERESESERPYKAEKLRFTNDRVDLEITSHVTVNKDDLHPSGIMGKLVRNGAKQILAEELNRMYSEEGIKAHFTPEMLSALAAARLRAEQKRKKKARINKRKHK